jgi:hypothetical protein
LPGEKKKRRDTGKENRPHVILDTAHCWPPHIEKREVRCIPPQNSATRQPTPRESQTAIVSVSFLWY